MKYDANIQMGRKLLILYDKDKKVEIPFIYVKTFPKNIYHLDNNIKDKQTRPEVSEADPQRNKKSKN